MIANLLFVAANIIHDSTVLFEFHGAPYLFQGGAITSYLGPSPSSRSMLDHLVIEGNKVHILEVERVTTLDQGTASVESSGRRAHIHVSDFRLVNFSVADEPAIRWQQRDRSLDIRSQELTLNLTVSGNGQKHTYAIHGYPESVGVEGDFWAVATPTETWVGRFSGQVWTVKGEFGLCLAPQSILLSQFAWVNDLSAVEVMSAARPNTPIAKVTRVSTLSYFQSSSIYRGLGEKYPRWGQPFVSSTEKDRREWDGRYDLAFDLGWDFFYQNIRP